MADHESDSGSSSAPSARSSSKKGKPAMELPRFYGENFADLGTESREMQKKRAYQTASILCSNLADDVFNTICTKERQENPYALWSQFKSVYASDSILSGYEIWSKWEDTQFNNDLLKYISEIEKCVAEFNSIWLKNPRLYLVLEPHWTYY
ncbi:hypothetical protein PSTG_17830 [Puccinia striiformis f. sp. tritici PST-78]|uniref:Uncharacterized protein n=1 Tax=Puccinia striiformis f. sp. tritici PST-78 TaxID=1165861 RepID=A0A0L0UP16_9BASI|nr:hypothetical protein PSTG_17830 [Puccinia striiformis f. sp. tritici PST-78]